MDKRKTTSQIEREIQSALAGDATLFYPGGDGGGGSRRKKPGTPVVKPHARTSAGCRECSRLHSLEQHAAHGGGLMTGSARKAKAATKTKAKTKTTKARKTTAQKATPKTATKAVKKTNKTQKAIAREVKQFSINAGLAGRSALQLVREAVHQIGPDGRYGDQKVFISAVYRAIPPHALGMTLPEFKRWLIDRNRTGDLVLARADLVGAMDRSLVRDSEIEDRGATFHFILADSVK